MFCNRHILVQIQIQKQCFVLLYQTLFWVAFVSVLEKCVTENKLISKNYSGEEREGSPEPSCHYWVQVVCQSATCTVQRKEGQIQYNKNEFLTFFGNIYYQSSHRTINDVENYQVIERAVSVDKMYLAAVMLFTCIVQDISMVYILYKCKCTLYTHKMTDARKKKMSSKGEGEAE